MDPSSGSPHVVHFGVFEVDLRSGDLRRPGSKVRLQDKPLQILTLLLECPGELVTREELQRRLWTDGVVVDFEHSINTAVKRLREALGDDSEHPRFIETLPRHGYRFIAPVEGHNPLAPSSERRGAKGDSPPGSGGGQGVVVAGAIHEPPLQIQSIAVLPFDNLSHDPEQEYFAEGMTDALITNLGKIGALRVISRTTAMHYKGTKKALPEIARELNVDAAVEGTVQRSGDRVRVTAQLLDARTDSHLWAETYDRDLRDILALQSEVARTVTQQIKAALTPQEQTHLASARPVNPEAYEAYLRGRYQWNGRTEESLKKAAEYFQKAIELDPRYAPAYAGLADCYAIFGDNGFRRPREVFPQARASAMRALEIDPTLAEAHTSLGSVMKAYEWDWAGAEREFRRAIELNPNYSTARQFHGELLESMGRFEEAIAELKRARQLDPFAPRIYGILAWILYLARRYDEGLERFRKAWRWIRTTQSFSTYAGKYTCKRGCTSRPWQTSVRP